VDAGLSDRPPDWNTNLLVLGDFDLDRLDTPLFQGVRVQRALAPAELDEIPTPPLTTTATSTSPTRSSGSPKLKPSNPPTCSPPWTYP
jgi:hypothetical protein